MEIVDHISVKESKKGKLCRYYCMKSKAVSQQVHNGYIRIPPKSGRQSKATMIKLFRKHFEPTVHLTDIASLFNNPNRTFKDQTGDALHTTSQEMPKFQSLVMLEGQEKPPSPPFAPSPMHTNTCESDNKAARRMKTGFLVQNIQNDKRPLKREKGDRFVDPYQFEDMNNSTDQCKVQKNEENPQLHTPSKSQQVESFVNNASIVLKIRTCQDNSQNDDAPGLCSELTLPEATRDTSVATKKNVPKTTSVDRPSIKVSFPVNKEINRSPEAIDCNEEFGSVIEGVSEENFIDDEENDLVIDEGIEIPIKNNRDTDQRISTQSNDMGNEMEGNVQISVMSSVDANEPKPTEISATNKVKENPQRVAPENFCPEIVSVTSLSQPNDLRTGLGFEIEKPKLLKRERKRKVFTDSYYIFETCSKPKNKASKRVRTRKVAEQPKINMDNTIKELKTNHSKAGEFTENNPLGKIPNEIGGEQSSRIQCNNINNDQLHSRQYHRLQNAPIQVPVTKASKLYQRKDSWKYNNNTNGASCVENPYAISKAKKRRKSLKSDNSTCRANSDVEEKYSAGVGNTKAEKMEHISANTKTSVNDESRIVSPGIAAPERLVRDFVNHNWLLQKYQIDQNPPMTVQALGMNPPVVCPVTATESTQLSTLHAGAHVVLPLTKIMPSSQIAALKLHHTTLESTSEKSIVRDKQIQKNPASFTSELKEEVSTLDVHDSQNVIKPILPKLGILNTNSGIALPYCSSNSPLVSATSNIPGTNVSPCLPTVAAVTIPKSNLVTVIPISWTSSGTNPETTKPGDPRIKDSGPVSPFKRPKFQLAPASGIQPQQNETGLIDLSVPKPMVSQDIPSLNGVHPNQHDVSDTNLTTGIVACETKQQSVCPSMKSAGTKSNDVLVELKQQFKHFEQMYKKLEKLEEVKEKETQDLKLKVKQAALQMDQIHKNINRLVQGKSNNVAITEKCSELESSENIANDTGNTKTADMVKDVLDLSKNGESTYCGNISANNQTNVAGKDKTEKWDNMVILVKGDVKTVSLPDAVVHGSKSHYDNMQMSSIADKPIVKLLNTATISNVNSKIAVVDSPLVVNKDDDSKVDLNDPLVQDDNSLSHTKDNLTSNESNSEVKVNELKQERESELTAHQSNMVQDASLAHGDRQHDKMNELSTENKNGVIQVFSPIEIVSNILEEIIGKCIEVALPKSETCGLDNKQDCYVEEQVQTTLKTVVGPGRGRIKPRVQRGRGYRHTGPPNVTFGNRAALPFLHETVSVRPRHLVHQQQQYGNESMYMPMFQLRYPVHSTQETNMKIPMQQLDQSTDSNVMPNPSFEGQPFHHLANVHQQRPGTILRHITPQGSKIASNFSTHTPIQLQRPGMVTGGAHEPFNRPIFHESIQRIPHHMHHHFGQRYSPQQNSQQGWLQHRPRSSFPIRGSRQPRQPRSNAIGHPNPPQAVVIPVEDGNHITQGIPPQARFPVSQGHLNGQNGSMFHTIQTVSDENTSMHLGLNGVSTHTNEHRNVPHIGEQGDATVRNNDITLQIDSENGSSVQASSNVRVDNAKGVSVQQASPIQPNKLPAENNRQSCHPHNPTEPIQNSNGPVQKTKSPPAYPGKQPCQIVKKPTESFPDTHPRIPGATLTNKPRCVVCNKKAIFICSGCKKVPYCSPKCQNAAWRIHSKDCK